MTPKIPKMLFLPQYNVFLAVGAYCHIKQDVTSWNYTEGAVVAVDLVEYERERDQCPLHFDDGSNPWKSDDSTNIIFNWLIYKSDATITTVYSLGVTILTIMTIFMAVNA